MPGEMPPIVRPSPSPAPPPPPPPPQQPVGISGSHADFVRLAQTGPVQLSADIIAQIAFKYTRPPIDSGGFSTIYAGRYFNTDVVVKQLTIRDPSELAMFFEELAILRNPDFIHPNLVPLIAYCTERPALVFQYFKPMKPERMQRLPLDVRERIALDLARGVAHMHSKGYVHRDLKFANLLLEFDANRHFLRALLSDMGCARPITTPIPPFGTMLYMDPPLLALMSQHAQGVLVKPECYNDVYSLALCIASILTAREPRERRDFDFMIDEVETHDVARGQLLRAMIQDAQLRRPTAQQVVAELERQQHLPRRPRIGAFQPIFTIPVPLPVPVAAPATVVDAVPLGSVAAAPSPQGYQHQPAATVVQARAVGNV